MNFICQEGKWTWQRTIDSFEFTAWYVNQPDNNQGYQNCLMLSHSFGFQWDDNSCALKRSFICEKFQSMCISRFDFLTSWLINCYILIANHNYSICNESTLSLFNIEQQYDPTFVAHFRTSYRAFLQGKGQTTAQQIFFRSCVKLHKSC